MQSLRADLSHCLDESGFIEGADADERYRTDWSRARGSPLAVLRPGTPDNVAKCLHVLHARQIPVVVHGGMTGLVGACVPQQGEVVLSLERLRSIEEIDPINATVTVQAGVCLDTLQKAAAEHSLFFPVDIGSRGSCQIGGMVATNAGGNRVLRYGMMRESVLGLEAVLADGTVISRMVKVLKDNAGYDLKHLFIGSEGTLGIITRVLLKLVPLHTSSQSALVSLENLEQVHALLHLCRRALGGRLSSFEVMWRDYFDTASAITASGHSAFQRPGALLVLVEALGNDAEADVSGFEACMGEALALGEGVDAVIAQSLAEAGKLWALREASGDAAQTMAPWVGFDVSVPLQVMERLVDTVRQGVQALDPQLRTQTYGHLGDGNLHFVVGPLQDAAQGDEVKLLVHRVAGALEGSVSGEHGIGMLKKAYLGMTRSASEIVLMRTLKTAMAPLGLLNRNRVFDFVATPLQ